jgi:hypothetical protein
MVSEFVPPTGRSIIAKKSDGSQVKESTDSSTTLEDDDVKGKHDGCTLFHNLHPVTLNSL